MFPQGQRTTIGSGISLTKIGKIMLITYVSVYVFELIGGPWLGIPLYQWLALNPLHSDAFHLWQLVTHPLVHDPASPYKFLFDCIIFFFFAGSVETALGTRHFLKLYIIAAMGGAACGMAFSSLAPFAIVS